MTDTETTVFREKNLKKASDPEQLDGYPDTGDGSPVSHFNRQITVLCLDRPRNARRRKHLPGEKSPGFSFPARQETR